MYLILIGIGQFSVWFILTGMANDAAVKRLPTVIGVPLLVASALICASSIVPISMGIAEIVNHFKYG